MTHSTKTLNRIESSLWLESKIIGYTNEIREILGMIECPEESREMIEDWSNDLEEQVLTLLGKNPDPQGEPGVGFWIRAWMGFATCDVPLSEFETLEQAMDKMYGAGEIDWLNDINPHLKYKAPHFQGRTIKESHEIHKGQTQRLIGLLVALEGVARDWNPIRHPNCVNWY